MPVFQAPKGTRDILPPESSRWEALIAVFARQARAGGYGLLQSPTFEDYEVFQRVGEGTDVVRKEMYEFDDKAGRHLALRPEGTASVVRAFVQHRPTTPWKTWYATPCFRYEAPQAGRYRQHHQLGLECIGSADPDVDVEIIGFGHDFLRSLGLRQVSLVINSMGDVAGRMAYAENLQQWLRARVGQLAPDDREKVEAHPMRVLDSKRPQTQAVTADAPRLVDHLSDEGRAHFERVQEGLTALGIAFTIEPRLVRGFDYYTHTAFEFQGLASDAAQSTVLGGGRYDGLVEEFGGPPTPGVGFGCGIERVLLACDAEGVFDGPDRGVAAYVIDVTDGQAARDLTFDLRRAGVSADRAFDHRSMKAQMRAANNAGAKVAVIVGDAEAAGGTVSVRPLRVTGDAGQKTIPRDQLIEHLRTLLEDE